MFNYRMDHKLKSTFGCFFCERQTALLELIHLNKNLILKTSSFLLAVLILCFITACHKDSLQYSFGKQGLVTYQKPGTWGSGGKSITVQWDQLIQESRCPNGAECFWEGVAEVQFTVEGIVANTVNIKLGTLTVASNGFAPNELDTLGYHFKLINLSPYPAIGHELHEGEYQATLVVSK